MTGQQSCIQSNDTNQVLSGDKQAVYDRQLRLWGVEVQNRLTRGRVLLAGNLDGVGAEVAKNVVLSGIGHVTLMDNRSCTNDACSNFLVQTQPHGAQQSVAQGMVHTLATINPWVDIHTVYYTGDDITQALRDHLSQDQSTGVSYDLVVLVDVDLQHVRTGSELLHSLNVKHTVCSTRGMLGYMVHDLGTHQYSTKESRERGQTLSPLQYCSIHDTFQIMKHKLPPRTDALLLALAGLYHHSINPDKKHDDIDSVLATSSAWLTLLTPSKHRHKARDQLPHMLDTLCATNIPRVHAVATILGGFVSNDVVSVISSNGVPVHNILLVDGGRNFAGTVRLGIEGGGSLQGAELVDIE